MGAITNLVYSNEPMSISVASKTVTIVNPHGLHARPADLFVRRAIRFDSSIEIIKGPLRVDGKSILQLLTLAAPYGTELTILAKGRDAAEAVEALARLLAMPESIEEAAG